MSLRSAVATVSKQLGVSERTLWRWLRSESSPAEKAPWQPSDDDLLAYGVSGVDAPKWQKNPASNAD
jgi:hypothetical protein